VSSRLVNGLGLLVAVASLLIAVLYFERTLYLEPCPLCIIDRLFVAGIGVVFLLALLHNPGRTGQRFYAFVNLLLVAGGTGVAARHVWLQHLPPDQVPECGASLSYMLDTLPLNETLQRVLRGSGECAEIQWTLLGLSIPEQTLILFAGLMVLVLIQLLRRSD
jgi:disulfide bond formation protein DsbB